MLVKLCIREIYVAGSRRNFDIALLTDDFCVEIESLRFWFFSDNFKFSQFLWPFIILVRADFRGSFNVHDNGMSSL